MTTILVFLFGGALTYALSLFHNKLTPSFLGLLNHYFPWQRLKTRSTLVDIAIYIVARFSQRFIAIAGTALTVICAHAGAHEIAVLLHFNHKLTTGPAVLVILSLAMFIFADFGEFFSHWLQHKIPFFWQFHKVHHSATFLTPLTTTRFHPVGNLMDSVLMAICLAIPAGIASYFYDLSLVKLIAIAALGQTFFTVLLLAPLQHSHFNIGFGKLEWIFISPQMHQIHHSTKREHWDKNMASRLAIWDWMFGTAVRLKKGETLSFGLGTIEDQRGDYHSILWCYVGPLIGCYRLLKGKLPKSEPLPDHSIPKPS